MNHLARSTRRTGRKQRKGRQHAIGYRSARNYDGWIDHVDWIQRGNVPGIWLHWHYGYAEGEPRR